VSTGTMALAFFGSIGMITAVVGLGLWLDRPRRR
jgi:hypothetical protein